MSSAFRLRSLRRGRGGLSFAWQLFNCKFVLASITSKMPFTYMDKMMCFVRVFSENFFTSCSLHKSYLKSCVVFSFQNNPFTYTQWERSFLKSVYKSLLHCTNSVHCYCAIFSFKSIPSLLPTGKRILLPHFEKKFSLSLIPNGRGHF